MEIYGTEGILTLPDPNNFGGWGNDVYLTRVGNAVNGKNEVFRVPFTHGFGDTDPSIPPLKMEASFHQASSTPSTFIIKSPTTIPKAPTTKKRNIWK